MMDSALGKLHDWVVSIGFAKLIAAYPAHYRTGTLGTAFSGKDKPAVMDETGVLRPERFSEYMMELQKDVMEAVREKAPLRPSLSLQLLQSTLEQMYDSVSLPDDGVKALFAKGKEMGRLMREGLSISYGSGRGGRC